MSKHHNNDLPAVTQYTAPLIRTLASHLNVESQCLVSESDIQRIREELPKLLELAAGKADTDLLLRLGAAIAVGALDSATNYAGNITILALRKRFKALHEERIPIVLRQFVKPKKLQEMQDSNLFRLCRQFGFITDQDLIVLLKNRKFRNDYSAAHPAVGKMDIDQFLSFVEDVWTVAMNEHSAKPIMDTNLVLENIHSPRICEEQLTDWSGKLSRAIETEGSTIFRILHGTYCESTNDSNVQGRIICLCQQYIGKIPGYVIHELIEQHWRYCRKSINYRNWPEDEDDCATTYDDDVHLKASNQFFKLAIRKPHILRNRVKHREFYKVIDLLRSTHIARRSFHNEPVVAKMVSDMVQEVCEVPESSRYLFVETIVACAIGSGNGVAPRTENLYHCMIRKFSQDEVEIMLALPDQNQYVGQRIRTIPNCKKRFREITSMLDEENVPECVMDRFQKWSA